jgi:hypothetical protein
MLKWFADLVSQVVFLTRDMREVRQEVKDLREQVEQLTGVVRELAFELQRVKENEFHEREKMALRLENVLLRFERRLPPARQDPNSEPDDL